MFCDIFGNAFSVKHFLNILEVVTCKIKHYTILTTFLQMFYFTYNHGLIDCHVRHNTGIVNSVLFLFSLWQMTPDGNFILDVHPRWKNIIIAAGFSGQCFVYRISRELLAVQYTQLYTRKLVIVMLADLDQL